MLKTVNDHNRDMAMLDKLAESPYMAGTYMKVEWITSLVTISISSVKRMRVLTAKSQILLDCINGNIQTKMKNYFEINNKK